MSENEAVEFDMSDIEAVGGEFIKFDLLGSEARLSPEFIEWFSARQEKRMTDE